MLDTLKEPWRAFRRAAIVRRERAGDQRMGIETEGHAPVEAHIDPTLTHAPYEPFQFDALQRLDREAPVSPEDVIYDLGSGLGRVLCHYAAKPVRRVVGVEYDRALAEASRANVERMVGRRAPVEVVEGDAGAQDYAEATLAFMYNPFGADTLRRVLRRLPARPELRVIYANPVHRAVFDDFPHLHEARSFAVPYDLGSMEVVVWRPA